MLESSVVALALYPDPVNQFHVYLCVIADGIQGAIPGVPQKHGHRHIHPADIFIIKDGTLCIPWVNILPVPNK